MSADSMRSLSTNAGEVEQIVWHGGTRRDKRRAGRVSQEVLARIRLDSHKLTVMQRLEYRRQPLAISGLSPLDQIVASGFGIWFR
jgi:hypothetical protein